MLELVVLAEEIVAFCVTADGLAVARHQSDRDALAAVFLNETELYDALIRPSEGALARARQLVVVPDPRLAQVAFAALYEKTAGRHLIERMPVSAGRERVLAPPRRCGRCSALGARGGAAVRQRRGSAAGERGGAR